MYSPKKIILTVVVFVASSFVVSLCNYAWFEIISAPLSFPIQLSVSIFIGITVAGPLAHLFWIEFWKGYWERIKNAPRSRIVFTRTMFIFAVAALLFALND